MLSSEQKKDRNSYKYRAGMVNVVYVAGILRHPRKNEGFIQQTNNLNQMIHFKCEPGVTIPRDYQEGQPIKIIARQLNGYVDGKPVIELEAKAFMMPSIQDMPPRKAWEQALREGVPRDTVQPGTFREERLDGWRVQDTGNMAELGGFVAAFNYEAPKSEGNPGCTVIYIRQTKDEKDLLPVRVPGTQAKTIARLLAVGMPLYIVGRISVDIKNTGEPADEKGILPTHKYQYLRATNVGPPSSSQVTFEPDWVPAMIQTAQSQRQARAQAHAERAAQNAAKTTAPKPGQQTQGEQLEASQKPVTPQEQSGVVAAQNAPSVTADIPPGVLAMLRQTAPQ